MADKSEGARIAAAKAAELTAKLMRRGAVVTREVLPQKQDPTTMNVEKSKPVTPQVNQQWESSCSCR